MTIAKHIWPLSLLLLTPPLAQAQTTQGPLNPGTISTGACSFSYSSTLAYSPSANVATSNNVYASATHCNCCDANTNCLQLTNFGFTLPASAVVTGIRVDIERRAPAGSQVQDNGLRLLKGGLEVGSNLAAFGTNWPSIDTYVSYGGCSNLWGTTWTVADINASNFGLTFATINYSCSGNVTSFIDNIRMTVCYNSTLPVSLTRFIAQQQNESVRVEWQTVAEWDNDYFVIEHSVNGDDYLPIGTLEGRNGPGVHDYFFMHENPSPGMNYYRLVQRDHDGKKEIFGPSPVDFTSHQHFTFSATWQGNNLLIDAHSRNGSSTIFSVYNMAGEMISSSAMDFPAGQGQITLALPGLSPGIYFVSASDEKGPVVNRKTAKTH